MSITDELRTSGVCRIATDRNYFTKEELTAIADRIDAAVKGMVELPKDADDVPWSVGDRDEDGNVVTELRLTYDGCWFVITDGEWPYRPKRKRHYHAPTVEEVLTEFGIDWEHESDCEDRAALLKEFAAKLRLAGDAE